MGSLSDHVDIVVTADSLSPTRLGFGGVMVLSGGTPNTGWGADKYRLYNRQSEVEVDWDSDTPEALATSALFSQNPRPSKVYIGKSANKPTLVYTLDVVLVENEKVYSIDIDGPGITTTTASFTADADAVEAEVLAGLVVQLNLVAGNNYTAAVDAGTIIITADNPGDWFSVAVDPTYISSYMTHADPGVGADLTAIEAENSEWYWLYTLYNSEPYATAVATWVNTRKKFYVAQSSDTRDLLTSTGTAGLLDYLAASGRTRVAGDYHPNPALMAGAALIGNIAPRTPGSWTAKFKKREGVTAVGLSATHRTNLVARFANFYELVSGVNITSEGTTSAGPTNVRGFIDNVVSIDYVEDDVATRVFGSLAGAAKIPRTDEGMVILENDLVAAMDNAVALTIAAADPEPVVNIPLISEMDAFLPRGVTMGFEFTLAGAIHSVRVNGLVVV